MTRLGTTDSWWMDTAPGRRYRALEHDVEMDVAVVGAGIVGISVAWELTRSGLRVALLDASTVAGGVTGHTTAKLTSLHQLLYGRITSDIGAEAAHLYARSQDDAIHHVIDTIERLGIACELEVRPALTWSTRADVIDRLQNEAKAAEQAGLAASFITQTDLPFPVAGAVRVEDQYQFHPRQYLLGVVAAMDNKNVAIHEQTRVVALQEGHPCRLTTDQGHRVTADHVVVATHYPIFDRSLLFTRLTPKRVLVIAGRLEGEDVAGMYITPDHRTRSVRTAPLPDGGRILIVTGERFRPGSASTAEGFARLTKWASDNFPVSTISHRWATQDNDSIDGLPLVGPLHPFTSRVWVAAGFGGWGMSNGVMAARLLTRHIVGEPLPEWGTLYDTRRFDPLREALPLAKAQATVASHFVGDRLRHLGAETDGLNVGEGKVILHRGRHLAVQRTSQGRLTALSARCTHLGCLVQFNNAEQSWDCPCHGSRFDLDGSVLHGPATEPLSHKELPKDTS